MERQEPGGMRRRSLFALPLLLAAGGPARVRLGVVQFGTVQWLAETIRRQGLAAKHGISITPRLLANTDGARVALLAGEADIVGSDWAFAAVQRARGTRLCYAPLSSALGGVMVPAGSPVRTLGDLAGRRLGVAGGPVDKSWLIVRAAARQTARLDLAKAADVAYGAPPLLGAKLQQGELDAVLTFWTFAARLEAAGLREAVSVADCAAMLGLPRALPIVGFVFHEDWAIANRQAITGFLTAVTEAEQTLSTSDAAWMALRPMMNAPEDALFWALRRRFLAGVTPHDAAGDAKTLAQVLAVLLRAGGPRATAGLTALPDGLIWNPDGTHA